MYSNLLSALKTRASVSEATNPSELASIVSTVKPTVILITTAEPAERKYSAIRNRLVDYARAGGTVIFCGMFSSFIRPPRMDEMWITDWNLPWKFGDYHRTTFSLNPSCTQKLQNLSGMPKSYNMKAVHIEGATREAAVYVTTEESKLHSNVWAARSVHDTTQAPVLFTSIGSGYVGFMGDVNAETESTAVILGMSGLLG